MGQNLDFVTDRAVKSISAAKQVAATWTWSEKSIADYEVQLTGITGNKTAVPPVIGQEAVASAAEQTMINARGVWDLNLDQLHSWTVQSLGMARSKYRKDAVKTAQLNGLTASSNSRAETLSEALDWESAWGNIDPAWAPLPALTLAAFKTLREGCNETFKTAYSDAQAGWRDEVEELGQMLRDMEDVNEAWYADATIAFPEGTPEGDMIRSTVPTTYVPAPAKPAAAAAPATAPAPAAPAPGK